MLRAQRFGLTRAQPENFDKLHKRGERFGTQAPVVDGELVKAVKRFGWRHAQSIATFAFTFIASDVVVMGTVMAS